MRIHLLSLVVTAALSACGSATPAAAPDGAPAPKATPASKTAPAPKIAPAPKTCLHATEVEAIQASALSGDVLTVCLDDDQGCHQVNIKTGVTGHTAALPSEPKPPAPAAALYRFVADEATEGGRIDIFRPGAKAPHAKITPLDDSNICMSAKPLGKTVLVEANVCAGPGGIAWLANAETGAPIATIGAPAVDHYWGAYNLHSAHVAGDLWAFREQSGEEVVIHDITSGALVARIDLRHTLPKDDEGYLMVGPEFGAMHRHADGTLVVVNQGRTAFTVTLIDATAKTILRTISPPACPPE